jgi:uncharacterized protein YbcI
MASPMSEYERPTQADSKVLTEPDHLEGVRSEDPYGITAQISNAMVGLKKQFYGRGPQKAKTFINDDTYIFCVLEGGLTQNEKTLLDAGEERLIRQYRLRFQEVMADQSVAAIEEIVGRKVLTFHSQILFDPSVSIEMFILAPRD